MNVLKTGILLFACATSISCSKSDLELEESKGFIELSFETVEISSDNLKKASKPHEELIPAKVSITFKNKQTNEKINVVVDICNDDGYYHTDAIEIDPGHYKVVFFAVLDKDDNIIYLNPLKGSKWAKKINDPISLEIKVLPFGRFMLMPKVVPIHGSEPSDFGLMEFSFAVMSVIDFSISSTTYDENKKKFVFIQAEELILDAVTQDTIYHGAISEGTNHLKVRDGIEIYMLLTSKEGYATDTVFITNKKLKEMNGVPIAISLFQNLN
jgi:hypothetical protein